MILIQAGHSGRTSGSTGAPGEMGFNIDVSDQVANRLRQEGVEVRRVNADPISNELTGDFELFLAVHYDANIYNTGGFFVDFPEPSTDGATEESQRMASCIRNAYSALPIVHHPERSNKNTRYYYMWNKLSSKTPCVIIECGVGQHKPDDYELLFNQRSKVVDALTQGVLSALRKEPMLVAEMVIKKVDFERLVTKSTAYDAILAKYEVTDAEGLARVFAGKDSRITDLGNQLGEAQAQVKNDVEVISRLKADLLTARGDVNVWMDRVEEAAKTIEQLGKDKGNLAIEVKQLKNQIDTLKLGSTEGITKDSTLKQFAMWLSNLFIRN